MEFVETDRFTKKCQSSMTDDDERRMQKDLIEDPRSGRVIQRTGGFRKLRVRTKGRGKSGSVRVIYFLVLDQDQILLYDLFEKSDKDNLTKKERNVLKQVSAYLK